MPRSRLLCDQRFLSTLSWDEVTDLLLGNVGRQLANEYIFQGESLDEFFVQRSNEELQGCRSRNGLLNITAVNPTVFKQQFRFCKADFEELYNVLAVPDLVTSAQGVRVPGREALCIALRRLAYPNRWCDMETLFGRHMSVMSSVTSNVLRHIVEMFGKLLSDMNNHPWLTAQAMEEFAQAVQSKGAPLSNCWAFIDGTARPICHPKRDQQSYFSGHKRTHVLKYQSIMCPNGIVCELDGPYRGRRHDAGILRDSGAYERMQRLMEGKPRNFVIYGDPAYPLWPLLMKPYGGASLTATQRAFNFGMSGVRQAVEWGFGKVVSEFAFLDFKKNQKLLKQDVAQMYKAATILSNCHTCLYGSQVTTYFGLQPLDLSSYLQVCNDTD